MNNEDPTKYNEIEAYLRKQLSKEQQEAFEAKVAEDSTLAREVKEFKFHDKAMEAMIGLDAQDKVMQWIPELRQQSTGSSTLGLPANKQNWTRWGGWLALMITLIFFSLYLLGIFESKSDTNVPTSKPSPAVAQQDEGLNTTEESTSVIADYLQWANIEQTHRTLKINTLGGTNEIKDLINKGLVAYEKRNYQAAIAVFTSIEESGEPVEQIVLEALAYSHFQLDQPEIAQGYFRQLLSESESTRFNQDYEWHLLLTYLMGYPSQKDEFTALLEKIGKDSSPAYRRKAQALAKKIDTLAK